MIPKVFSDCCMNDIAARIKHCVMIKLSFPYLGNLSIGTSNLNGS